MKCPQCGYENPKAVQVCNSCGKLLQPPEPATAAPVTTVTDAFALDKYLMGQKLWSPIFSRRYVIADEQQQPLLYVESRLGWGGYVSIYDDESKANLLLRVAPVAKQRTFFDTSVRIQVEDAQGQVIGSFETPGLVCTLLNNWTLNDSAGRPIGRVQADSLAKALFRRFLPEVGFLKREFHFYLSGMLVGKLVRRRTILERYVLDLTFDHQRLLDRRLAIGMAVWIEETGKG